MPAHTPVISFASSKGGAGKSTATLTLASELVQQLKKPITIIECDANEPFVTWADLKRKPDLIKIVSDESEDTILDNIEKAKRDSAVVLIDLEGTKNERVAYAMSESDLVVIPVQGSFLDAKQARDTVAHIRRTEKMIKRKIEFGVLYTRVSARIITKNFASISRAISDQQIPVLEAQLVDREAFRTMFYTGRTLHDLPDDVSGLQQAKEDAYQFAKAIIDRINQRHKNRADVAA